MNVYISDRDPTVKPGARAPVRCTLSRPIQPWPRWALATDLSQTEWAGLMVLKWYLLLLVTAVPDSMLWCSYRLTSRAEWRWWLWAQIRIALLHRRYAFPNPSPKPLPCYTLKLRVRCRKTGRGRWQEKETVKQRYWENRAEKQSYYFLMEGVYKMGFQEMQDVTFTVWYNKMFVFISLLLYLEVAGKGSTFLNECTHSFFPLCITVCLLAMKDILLKCCCCPLTWTDLEHYNKQQGTSKQTTKCINSCLWLKTLHQLETSGGGEWTQASGPPWWLAVHVCVFFPCIWAPAQSFSQSEPRGSGTHWAERPLATMPARSLQHFGTPVARCISFSLSASRLSPNPHLFLSASIFLSSQRVCPYSQDISSPCVEALLLTLGTPDKMVNRHTSFCRQAPQLHSGPEDTSESDLPLILILYREDQWACKDPGVTLPVP